MSRRSSPSCRSSGSNAFSPNAPARGNAQPLAGTGQAGGRGGAPRDPDFICIEPLAGIINGLNLPHKGLYKELQHIQPAGGWQASFWIRPTGF